ncbi:MAG: hypothetical protein ACUVXA_05440 [Candidatus Jordarchaeum sp.]|uniref:hypothetical protein n=1 Tax=Candidatus Jordarchaeum sp. TaxID=2823881 RepID=UPI004049CE82
MEIFDLMIEELRQRIENWKEQGRKVREKQCSTSVENLKGSLPISKQPGIILKEDTFVELGNPKTASAALVLWTKNLELVRDGKITIVGPDIPESEGNLPFAQILIAQTKGLEPEDYRLLSRNQYNLNLEGYMLRAVPQRQRVWSRVSREAVERGFTLETLGRALMVSLKENPPVAEAVEVIFVTSGEEDVRELGAITEKAWRTATPVKSTPAYDCTNCENEEICDEIWRMLQLRRGLSPNGKRPPILCSEFQESNSSDI